jgi:hypothetical protein
MELDYSGADIVVSSSERPIFAYVSKSAAHLSLSRVIVDKDVVPSHTLQAREGKGRGQVQLR